MTLLKIIFYFISVYGLSFMMVYQEGPFNIFTRIRKLNNGLNKLLSCMFCTPTWLGMIFSLVNMLLFTSAPFTLGFIIFGNICYWPLIFIFDMLTTPVIVHFMDLIENKLSNN